MGNSEKENIMGRKLTQKQKKKQKHQRNKRKGKAE